MRLATVALFLLLIASASLADPDPYAWIIAHPDGSVTTGAGVTLAWHPLQPGEHTIMLTVQYAHEDPFSPGQAYVATTTELVAVTGDDLRSIFADGFENGTASAWSAIQGGWYGTE